MRWGDLEATDERLVLEQRLARSAEASWSSLTQRKHIVNLTGVTGPLCVSGSQAGGGVGGGSCVLLCAVEDPVPVLLKELITLNPVAMLGPGS